MRKEDNREKYKEYDHRYYIKHRRPNSKIGKLETKISDPEAKLAGKDQAIESLEELNRSLGQTCNNDRKEIERLRELISDKEKENDKLIAKLEQADEIINNPNTLIFQQQELIDNLQSQLAEKDGEIKQLKKFDDLNKTFFDLFRTAFKEPDKVDDLFNTLKTMQEKQDQDKISFAIEQLNKVKEKALHFYVNDTPKLTGFYVDVNEIENQINQLTHQHEDKRE